MDQRRSAGFAELVIVIAGMVSLAAYSAFNTLPQAGNTFFSSNTPPTATVTPISSIKPKTIDAIEAKGDTLTDDFHLEVTINGEPARISLLGIEQSSYDTECVDPIDLHLDSLENRIHGRRVFLVENTTSFKDNAQAYYVFLDDLTFLNTHLIASGLVKSHPVPHAFRTEFLQAEQTARDSEVGIWAPACQPSPTVALIPLTTLLSPTASPTPIPSPTRTPSPSRTPTPSRAAPSAKKTGAPIQRERTHNDPSITPTLSLEEYIPATPSVTISVRSNNPDLILQMINIHRKTKSLPAFEKHPDLCKLAESRAPELHNEIFGSSWIHAGFYNRDIPYWITENMASYPTEEAVVQWWLGSTVHRAAIEGDYQYSCGACSANSCAQLFTSFSPK